MGKLNLKFIEINSMFGSGKCERKKIFCALIFWKFAEITTFLYWFFKHPFFNNIFEKEKKIPATVSS